MPLFLSKISSFSVTSQQEVYAGPDTSSQFRQLWRGISTLELPVESAEVFIRLHHSPTSPIPASFPSLSFCRGWFQKHFLTNLLFISISGSASWGIQPGIPFIKVSDNLHAVKSNCQFLVLILVHLLTALYIFYNWLLLKIFSAFGPCEPPLS